eukprot:470746-Pyramimonas_sp.AAC.2
MMFRQSGFSDDAHRLLLDRALQHQQKSSWQHNLLYASRTGCPWDGPIKLFVQEDHAGGNFIWVLNGSILQFTRAGFSVSRSTARP